LHLLGAETSFVIDDDKVDSDEEVVNKELSLCTSSPPPSLRQHTWRERGREGEREREREKRQRESVRERARERYRGLSGQSLLAPARPPPAFVSTREERERKEREGERVCVCERESEREIARESV